MQPSLNPPAGEVIEPDRPLGLLPVSQDGVRQFTCMEVGQVHHFNMTKSEFSSKTIRGISEHLRRMVVHVCGVRHEDHTSDPETRSPVDCPIRNLTVASPDLNLACAHPGHVASTLTHYIAILKGLKRIDDAHAAALQQKLEDAVAELHKLDATAIDRYDNLRHGAHEENTKIRMGIKEEQKVIGEKMADVVQVLRDEFDAMLLQFGAVPREDKGVTHGGNHWVRHENRLYPYDCTVDGVRFYTTLPDEIDGAARQIAAFASIARFTARVPDMSYEDLVRSIRENFRLPSGVVLSQKPPAAASGESVLQAV